MSHLPQLAFVVVLAGVQFTANLVLADDFDSCMSGGPDERISSCNRIIQANMQGPDLAAAYSLRGFAFSEKRDNAHALADFNQALLIKPDFARALYGRGNAHADNKELDLAIADYEKAISLEPEFLDALIGCATTYQRRNYKGDLDREIQDLDAAIRLEPNRARSFNDRGAAYAWKGDHKRAIEDLNRATDLDPNYAIAFVNRGNEYANIGNNERGILDLDAAIKIDPSSSFAFYARGTAYLALKNYGKATADFTESIRLNPNNDGAVKALANLQDQLRVFELVVCNKTQDEQELLVAGRRDPYSSALVLEGWYDIEPGQCDNTFGKFVNSYGVYWVASTPESHEAEGNDGTFCVDERGPYDPNYPCPSEKIMGFFKLTVSLKDTQHTLNLIPAH